VSTLLSLGTIVEASLALVELSLAEREEVFGRPDEAVVDVSATPAGLNA
jgi:hypothetical protein